MPTLTTRQRGEQIAKQLGAIADGALADGRSHLNADEQTKADGLLAEMKTVKDDIEAERKGAELFDQVKAIISDDTFAADVNAKALAGGSTGVGSRPGGLPPGKSHGDLFTDHAAYKAWQRTFDPGAPERKMRVDIEGLPVGGVKALLTGTSNTSAGAMTDPQWLGLQDVGPWFRPFTVRDVITVGQTNSDTIEYARQVSQTNAAAPVLEATSSAVIGDGTGGTVLLANSGTKPESALAFEIVTTTVKTIAHWIPATTRALADAGQLRTIIDQFLRQGLEEELEDQIVNGSGAGQNFTGILNTSGIQAQAFATDVFVTARKALTKVRVIGRSLPTAFLINPADDETIDLMRDGQSRFFGMGPFGVGPATLWGVPRVVTEAVPAGLGIVGDLRRCVLWDRENATISASNSHADFFTRNLVAILAELRAAFGIIKPAALCTVDWTA